LGATQTVQTTEKKCRGKKKEKKETENGFQKKNITQKKVHLVLVPRQRWKTQTKAMWKRKTMNRA